MKKSLLASVVACILLTSCSGQRNNPTEFRSLTAEPIFTATAVATPILSSTPTQVQATEVPSSATFTPFPLYHTKKIVFEYYTVGQHSYFDMFYPDCCELPMIVLYDDGQMILGGEQKVLSADEIEMFLSKLDSMGFFSLESNQRHDPTDKLYDYGNNYQKSFDGIKYCILTNAEKSRKLCAYEPDRQFLIPEMKNILKYLDEYKPVDMTPYYPDRILLSIEAIDSSSDDLPATPTPWDSRFPSLDFSPPTKYLDGPPASILYIEGDMAKEIYIFLKNSPREDVFIQNGIKYRVQVDVVLPHQTVLNAYQ